VAAPPLGRGQGNRYAFILQEVVGSSKLFDPEAGFLPVLPSWSWLVSTNNIYFHFYVFLIA
jgi:hypothetical protein